MNNEIFIFDATRELHNIQAQTGQSRVSTISMISSNTTGLAKITDLKNHDEISNISNISNISRISSSPVANPYFNAMDKIEEIKKQIGNYARYWGETDENIQEYIKDQLAAYPLDDLIKCFRSLNDDIQHFQCPSANVAKVAN